MFARVIAANQRGLESVGRGRDDQGDQGDQVGGCVLVGVWRVLLYVGGDVRPARWSRLRDGQPNLQGRL